MIYLKRLNISLSAIVFSLISAQTIFACQTPPGETPFCYIYQSAQIVFVGEVVKSEPHNIVPDIPNLSAESKIAWTGKYNRLTFAVTENFKGIATGEFEALNLVEAVTSCDVITEIKLGQKWIVFAYQRAGKSEFYVSRASFFYDEAKEAKKLDYLRKVVNNETKPGIYGQFTANYPASQIRIEGYKVTAESDGKKFTTKMDEYGQYAFPVISGGIYRVKIQIPFDGYLQKGNNRTYFVYDKKIRLYTYEYETTVKDNECAYERVSAFPAVQKTEEK